MAAKAKTTTPKAKPEAAQAASEPKKSAKPKAAKKAKAE